MGVIHDYERAPITEEDFIAYLKAKGVKGECEACGSNSWSVSADNEMNYTLGLPMVSLVNIEELTRGGINMLATMCNNCSNTRLFWRFKVAEWKSKQAAVGGEVE